MKEQNKKKDSRLLKKRNLNDAKLTDKINAEKTDRKRVGKMQRKRKEEVSNLDLSEHPQATLKAISSEKTEVKKVELKKKMQKSKRKADEISSSPVDSKLNGKMKKKRKERGDNADISEHSQTVLKDEKTKGKKKKLNKKKSKTEEVNDAPVTDMLDGQIEDDHLKREESPLCLTGEGNKDLSEAVNSDMADNGTEIRKRKSKKSNKKKKKDTSIKANERSSEKVNEMEEEDVYEISSGDEDCSRGMKKWVTDYYESRPGLDVLQKRIDDFMTAHEERLEQEKQIREAKAAEGGWTVVVHHKGRKKTTDAESGIAVGSVAQAAVEDKLAKKKQNEPVAHGFYRFQKREAQRNEILALQSKFEQDKKRIQQLRAARKFKPY